jgi:hypothetical protein
MISDNPAITLVPLPQGGVPVTGDPLPHCRMFRFGPRLWELAEWEAAASVVT